MIVALDPGPTESAVLLWNQHDRIVVESWVKANEDVSTWLDIIPWGDIGTLVIEQVESYGMAVGVEVFETVFWSGRFYEVASRAGARVERLPRRAVKLHLCHSARAKDTNIRQALIDRFGPGKEKAIGKKASPGPLYGITSHQLAALALAVTWADQQGRGERA